MTQRRLARRGPDVLRPRPGTARLVLTRKNNEQIVVGEGKDQTIITVVGPETPVKLVIESPPHISIDRYEVAKAKGLV